MSTRVKSHCPHCNSLLKVDQSLLGRQVRCPACKQTFLLAVLGFSDEHSIDPSLEALQTRSGEGDGAGRIGDADTPERGKLGRFELRETLGAGGFGVVYRAFDPVLGREVALKVPKLGSSETARVKRFLTEARAAAHLHHPNIVAVFECGEAEGKPYIASEYVKGVSLTARLKSKRPGLQEAAGWVRTLADALAYAHDEGIVHRDIKPDNVLMAGNRPQITDFGLAKRTDEDSLLTSEGTILGTPAYMSPEQARGETDRIGPHSDQYSLGVVLYELLSGRRPFEGPPHVVLAQVTSQEPPALRRLNPHVPDDLSAICQKAMEKDPPRRYANMHEFADDLARWLDGRVTRARPIGPIERGRRWARRNRAIASLLATVAILVCAVAVLATVGFIRQTVALAHTRTALRQQQTESATLGHSAQVRLVENYLERGRSFALRGKVSEGLLWMVRSLETLPEGEPDLEHAIRMNIACWKAQLDCRALPLRHPGLNDDRSGSIYALACSLDGTTLLTSGFDHTARLWNAATGQLAAPVMQHSDEVMSAAFSPDGRIIATASLDRTVRFWRSDNAAPLGDPIAHLGHVRSLAFSPDGRTLATGTHWAQENVQFWDVATHARVGKTLFHEGAVECMAFSPDGRTLLTGVSAGPEHTARLWDVETGNPVGKPMRHEDWVRDCAFSPDGRMVVTASRDHTVRRWEASSGEPIGGPLQHSSIVEAVAFHPNGMLIAAGGFDSRVQLWDAQTGKPVDQTFQEPGGDTILCMCFDWRRKGLLIGCKRGAVWHWDFENASLAAGKVDAKSLLRDVAFSPDGRLFATANYDTGHAVRFWNRETFGQVGPVLEHPGDANVIVFSPDGKALVTGCHDGKVRFWDVGSGSLIGQPIVDGASVRVLAFSSDGRMLATGSAEPAVVRVWDIATREQIGPDIPLLDNVTECVGFSADGGQVLAGRLHDSKLRFWEVGTGRPTGEVDLHRQFVAAVALSPDGKTILTGSPDGTARFCDAATGRQLRTPLNHNGPVVAAKFAQDGKLVATGGQDQTVKLWSAGTGELIGPPLRHTARIEGLDVSPDGQMLVSVGWDGIIRAWTIPSPETGTPQAILDSLRSRDAMELDEDGTFRWISDEAFIDLNRKLAGERKAAP